MPRPFLQRLGVSVIITTNYISITSTMCYLCVTVCLDRPGDSLCGLTLTSFWVATWPLPCHFHQDCSRHMGMKQQTVSQCMPMLPCLL